MFSDVLGYEVLVSWISPDDMEAADPGTSYWYYTHKEANYFYLRLAGLQVSVWRAYTPEV